MNKLELIRWLQNQQSTLENIILNAAQAYVRDHQSNPNFGYDFAASQDESYNLSQDQDLCYDRVTTPLAYSLWYQARRINVFMSHFIDRIIDATTAGRKIEIFDLGAGTGCVQFCVGLVAVAMRSGRTGFPPVRVINIDISPFMLNYLRSYLWPAAIKHYPELRNLSVEYEVYSWSNGTNAEITNPWICASYLFDSSENKDYLVSNFTELIKSFNPEKILLLTSSQTSKKQMMYSISSDLEKKGFIPFVSASQPTIFTGLLTAVSDFRNKLRANHSARGASGVTWDDRSFMAMGLEKKQTGLSLDNRMLQSHVDMFNPPLRVRREVRLNEDQLKAARFETRPSIITGPAGCGKSIVITEKLINTLDHHHWQGPLNILVTTFNKSLLKQLRGWITDMLVARGKPIRQNYYLTTGDDNDGTGILYTGDQFKISIQFFHFEMLGKHIGDIDYKPFNESHHRREISSIIESVRKDLVIATGEMQDILNENFILEEYHRVIYGLQCRINLGENYYQDFERKGRGSRPRLDRGLKRKAVWTVLNRYAVWMHKDPSAGQSYLARRQLLFNKLSTNSVSKKFDYVFVDEFQDCTVTDFKIMSLLLKNVDNLVISGDLAQAVHIGHSGVVPRDGAMSRRVTHRLKGSYRLPFRICEAIYPLSQQLLEKSSDREITAEITPYKGAPPGARPIIVYAEDNAKLAAKIRSIRNQYAPFDIKELTIMEKDFPLKKELANIGQHAETTTILKLKGLEKDCVIWSLQVPIEYENELLEFAYTIVTRTNCLLIVALTASHLNIYKEVLRYFRTDRTIFWDQQSESKYNEIVQQLNQQKVA